MNGVEQRAHRTVTQSLDDRVSNVELVVMEIAAEVKAAIGAERAARFKYGDVLTSMVTTSNGERVRDAVVGLQTNFFDFKRQSLWGRLRWLVSGR